MTRIRSDPPETAEGLLAEVYDEVRQSRGAVANVHEALGLRPEALRAFLRIDTAILHAEHPGPALSRREREIVALVTAQANKDTYAFTHHADALSRHVTEPGLVAAVAGGAWRNRETAPALSDREAALAAFAAKMAGEPSTIAAADVDDLRKSGLDDAEILDAVLVAAHVGFVNRVSLALGVGRSDVTRPFQY